jgi:Putative abortive phage resistance protein AbiGi, antitoxin
MSSIIHFTRTFDTLKSILTDSSFRLFYCRKVLYLGDNIASSAVHPMVSFSEQIIKTINKKNITYGKFGIGLKQIWVIKNRLHPVLYFDKNSLVAKALTDLLKARRKNGKLELAPNVKLSIMTIKCFTKNAVGYNSFFDMTDFNFRAEKEWRYVPTKAQINNGLISQTKKIYDKKPDYYNDKLRNFPLKFQITDIEHIFVETEKQKNELITSFGIDTNLIKLSKWTTQLKKAKASA